MQTNRPLVGRACLLGLSLALFLSCSTTAPAAIIIVENTFIEKYKDRVTIDLDDFLVVIAHERPNRVGKGSLDGDMHVAGRSAQVRFATVAEIMNAARFKKAVDLIHEVEGNKKRPVRLSGAWRLWCEHPGKGVTYDQRKKRLPKYENSNPDHVFEIHPITRLEDIDLMKSLVPIDGYDAELDKPGRTAKAFRQYEDKRCVITPKDETTRIQTAKAVYNYVKFKMKLKSSPEPLEDGTLVLADVLNDTDEDDDEAVLAENIRMLSVRGSPVDAVLRGKRQNDVIQVLGVPRISLALVQERLEQGRTDPEILRETLPYEMILVGVYPSAKDGVPPVVRNRKDEDRAKDAKRPDEPPSGGSTGDGKPPFPPGDSHSSPWDGVVKGLRDSWVDVVRGFTFAVGVALASLGSWLLWHWPLTRSVAWWRRWLDYREAVQLLRPLPEWEHLVMHPPAQLSRLLVPFWYLWRLLLLILLIERRRRRRALRADVRDLAGRVQELDHSKVIEKPRQLVELIQVVSPRAAVLQAMATIEDAMLRLAREPYSTGDAITKLTRTQVLDTYMTGAFKTLAGLRDGAQFFKYKPSRWDAWRFVNLSLLLLQLLLKRHNQRFPVLLLP
jgi:hypothetical protein